MSFFDKAKEAAKEAAEKAKDVAEQAAEKAKEVTEKAAHKIEEGGYVDKAAGKIDEKTGGKYSDKIAKVAATTKEGVGKLTTDDEEEVVDMEYSTEFGAERTETAEEAAEVFEEAPEDQA